MLVIHRGKDYTVLTKLADVSPVLGNNAAKAYSKQAELTLHRTRGKCPKSIVWIPTWSKEISISCSTLSVQGGIGS